MISSALLASSGLAERAEMPMLEPPANAWATPPSIPGSGYTNGAAGGLSVSHSLARPSAQFGAENWMAAPSQYGVQGSALSPSFGATEASVMSCCTWARSEEHTSELQSLMRISYAVFCL